MDKKLEEDNFLGEGLGLGTPKDKKDEDLDDGKTSSEAAKNNKVPYEWIRNGSVKPPIDPPKQIFPKIYNMVAEMKLGTKINLDELFEKGRNLNYKPGDRSSRHIVMHLKKPCLSASVFKCGVVRIVGGVCSEAECKIGARRIARMIQKWGFKVTFKAYRVLTIMAQCNLPFPLSVDKMLLGLWNGYAERPVDKKSGESMPTVNFRFKSERNTETTISISENGHIRFIGMVSEAELHTMFLRAYSISRGSIKNKS